MRGLRLDICEYIALASRPQDIDAG